MDPEVWCRIRNGDVAAMKSLYQSSYQELFVYAFKIIGDKDKVKDSIHELFCEIWQNREKMAQVLHVKAYLKTCVRNKLLREMNLAKQFTPLLDERDVLEYQEYSYEQLLIKAQDKEVDQIKLTAALAKLTHAQKEIVRLKFYEGLSYEAIAVLLKLKSRTIYNHVFAALGILRKELKK